MKKAVKSPGRDKGELGDDPGDAALGSGEEFPNGLV